MNGSRYTGTHIHEMATIEVRDKFVPIGVGTEVTPITIRAGAPQLDHAQVRAMRWGAPAQFGSVADVVTPASVICWVAAAGMTLWWSDQSA